MEYRNVRLNLSLALPRLAQTLACALLLPTLAGLGQDPAPVPLPAAPAPVVAVPPSAGLQVSLREAILLALENNRALAVERLTPDITRTRESIEQAVFDPVAGAALSSGRQHAEGWAGADNWRHTVTDQIGLSAFVRQTSERGTTVRLSADTEFVDVSSSERISSTGPRISVTQALLQGASVAANLARIRQARINTAASEFEVRGAVEAVAANVEEVYWDFALAERRIEIFTESLKVAEQYLRETRDRIAAGAVAEIEVAAAEAEIPLRRQGLITATGVLEMNRLRLLNLLNPRGEGFWDLPVTLSDRPAAPQLQLEPVAAHVAVALKRRPELGQARLQVDFQELELVQTRNGLLPRLDAFITLGKTGYARSFPQSLTNLDRHSYDVSTGLSFEYPIGNRAATARQRQAVLSREQAEAALANLAQLIELEVRIAYVEVKSASEQVVASAATRRLRGETLRAESEKSRVGKSTSFLVAQAQRDLLASQIAEVEAVVLQLRSMTTLFSLESSLLERRGITLGEPPTP
jgi:outer membrane protein TolC